MRLYKRIRKFFDRIQYGPVPPPGLEREKYYLEINIARLEDQMYDVWCGYCNRDYGGCEHCDYMRFGLQERLDRKQERLEIIENKLLRKL